VVAGERDPGVSFTPFLTQLARPGCRFESPRHQFSCASLSSCLLSQSLLLPFLSLLRTYRHNTAGPVATLASEPPHLDDMQPALDDNLAATSDSVPK
jgi:hypothetical protein